MTTDQQRADYEAWAAEQDRPDSHPILATAIGVVVLLIGILGSRQIYAGAEAIGAWIGCVLFALIVWGIAYAITIRHAETGWKIGSLAIMVFIGLFAMLLATGRNNGDALARDMAVLTEIKLLDDGTIILPKNGNRGPLSRIIMGFLTNINDEAIGRRKRMIALGIDRIADAGAISRDPSLLRDCGRFTRERANNESSRDRMKGSVVKLNRDLTDSNVSPNVKKAVLSELQTDTLLNRLDGSTAQVTEQLGRATELCTLLARRRWRAQGDRIMFTSTADLNAYNALIVRWNEAIRANQRSLSEGKAKMSEGQEQINKALGR